MPYYYHVAPERLGVQIRYNTPVHALERHDGANSLAALAGSETYYRQSRVLAAGGFRIKPWMAAGGGENAPRRWPADNFLIRGTRFNGAYSEFMMDAGADIIGDPVPVALRSDCRGRRCTTAVFVLAWIAYHGYIVVNRDAERFMMKAKISGRSVTPFEGGWWLSSGTSVFDY